ncbi:hypothetical protein IW148_001654 [Coemansia sp. RSA 1199]|nr:hypothetical protein IW148_001654 [Coemansia sp. RSA 1199]
MQIQGKIAVVTGSARGIGRKIAETLVAKGAKVVVTDILQSGHLVARELNDQAGTQVAVFEQCDVSDTPSIQRLIDRAIHEFGGLDILVNNAGVGGTLPWADQDSSSLSCTIDINLKAPIEGTRVAVQYMAAHRREGCIVNIASIAAFHALEFTPVYTATKAALVSFTASCSTLATTDPRIRVNAIAQGYVDTDIVHTNVPDAVNKILRAPGEIPIEKVVDGVVRCIEDETLAGNTIKITSGALGVVHDGPTAVPFGFVDAVKQNLATVEPDPPEQTPKPIIGKVQE